MRPYAEPSANLGMVSGLPNTDAFLIEMNFEFSLKRVRGAWISRLKQEAFQADVI